MNLRHLLFGGLCVAGLAAPAAAQERQTLGFGRLLTNDWLGDQHDRWRTSSYVVSWMRGPAWQGELPDSFGALLEYRFRADIIAPQTLNGANSNDRAYAGSISAGVHTHWQQGPIEARVGADLVMVGPQTGLDDTQDWFHGLVDQPLIGPNVLANQVQDAFFVTVSGEVGYPVLLAPGLEMRPFAEAQYGVEDLVRVGVDFSFGGLSAGAMEARDLATGQRYRTITNEEYGWEFTSGVDYAYVADSAYFPASFGTVAQDTRLRGRLGVHWQGGKNINFFYGLTYLSEEYVGQPEGQLLGSVKLNFNF